MARGPAKPASSRARPRELSAYQRRVQRGLAAGKSLQEARGHRSAEHVERRERELRQGGLTTYQRGEVRRFARQQAKRMDADAADTEDALLAWVRSQRKGYERFRELRAEVASTAKQKRSRIRIRVRKDGTAVVTGSFKGRAKRLDRMERLTKRWGLPDWRMLFYH